jgi:hypothetical protein
MMLWSALLKFLKWTTWMRTGASHHILGQGNTKKAPHWAEYWKKRIAKAKGVGFL